jgi:hypothetical protein
MAAPARFEMVHRGYQTAAGFTLQDAFLPGSDGRTVAAVEPGSPAAEAGLEAGDVIVGINGESVSDGRELGQYLLNPENWRGHSWNLELAVQKGGTGPRQSLAFAPRTLPVHPTQVYESISMVLLFLLLSAFYPFRTRDGQVIALLMIGYGIHRYFNEMLRADVRPTGFENTTSLLLILGGAAILLYLRRRGQETRPAEETALARV